MSLKYSIIDKTTHIFHVSRVPMINDVLGFSRPVAKPHRITSAQCTRRMTRAMPRREACATDMNCP
jgi:hypothetical protein